MGFFSKLKDLATPPERRTNEFLSKENPIQKEQREQAERAVSQGQRAADFKREQFDILRQDIEPLRDLRNQNINRLLRLQGIGQEQDISDFRISPEFTTVRDAALQVTGDTPGQSRELAERANQLALGGFGNFQNRIFNERNRFFGFPFHTKLFIYFFKFCPKI